MDQIFPQMWIKLDREVREHLTKVFSIVRTGITEIIDQTVVSDGHTVEDLRSISLEKMNAYIGSDETFARAWEITLLKVNHELHPPMGQFGDEGVVTPVEETPVEETPAVEVVQETPVEEVDTRPNLEEILSEESKQYASKNKKSQ